MADQQSLVTEGPPAPKRRRTESGGAGLTGTEGTGILHETFFFCVFKRFVCPIVSNYTCVKNMDKVNLFWLNTCIIVDCQ